MAFESLTEKLQNVFKNLRGKGRLSEEDVKASMKEVRMALLEADVNFRVVKQFVRSVEEKAIGQDVMNGLNPGQMVVKIVNEELISLMGGEQAELTLNPAGSLTVLMMCGLQGSGKTTSAAKIAAQIRKKGRKPLLVACDVYRPAAIEQLQVNAKKVETDCFSLGTEVSPVEIARQSIDYAKKNGCNVVILDTAGRLQIEDAMTGQDAVNIAEEFNKRIGVDGLILSKLDGDSRGGAALSAKAVTGRPILFAGMGEKLNDLEPFYPDRMASRILGMGDVLTLIDKVAEANLEMDAQKEKELALRLRKGKFDFEMYLESMQQMRKMGGFGGLLKFLPGMGKIGEAQMPDEKEMAHTEAIVLSMTLQERRNPRLLNPMRKARIARGSGRDISEVNRLVKNFEQMQKFYKQAGGMKGMGKMLSGMGGFGKGFRR